MFLPRVQAESSGIGMGRSQSKRMGDPIAKLSALRKRAEELDLPPLMTRPWCQLKEPVAKEKPPSVIRLMQWNVLAQALSQGGDNFVLCPEKALSWEVRKTRVVEEILSHRPDIVCLEEVDTFSHFEAELNDVGYKGLFFPKWYSPCLDVVDNTGPDGCAIFYLKDKLTLVSKENVSIYVPPGHTLCNQVAILATFVRNSEHPQACPRFHVMATHLKAKSGYHELRKKEVQYLTDWVREKIGSEPLIFCGDFNGNPSEPFYQVLEESALKLSSVYKLITPDNQEPPYTTWKVRGQGEDFTTQGTNESRSTIDYIWISKDCFSVLSILGLPSDEDIGVNRLPSLSYPSDHLSLVCDLSLTS